MTARTHTFESHLFSSYWDDGLLDILAGVGVVGIGICWALDLVAIGAVIPAVVVPFWVPLRRALVEPRAGLVEFSDTRADHMRQLGRGSIALGAALLLLFVGAALVSDSAPRAFLTRIVPALPGVLLALMAALVAWSLRLPRFLIYAGAFIVAGFGVALTDGRPEVAMFVGGGAVLAGGAWRLRRLLQLPIESDDAEDD